MVLLQANYLQYKNFNFEQQTSAALHCPKLLTYITNHFNFEQQMSPHPDILMLNNISTALKSTNIDTFCLIARLLFSSTIYHQYAKSDFFQLNSLQINKTW